MLNYTQHGGYSSINECNNNPRIKRVMDDLLNTKYSKDPNAFKSIHESLIDFNDEFFVLKDFDSYVKAQERVDELYKDSRKWQQMCAVNIAHSGIFSSDRTISEYVSGIWGSELIYKNL